MRYGKLMLAAFIILSLTALPLSEAHILIVADSLSDSSCMYDEAKKVATTLKNRGYQVVELYKGNATVKNILKGMYGADAVIYAGHGGYMSGNYDCRGGYASPPFSLVASDGYIWGAGGYGAGQWTDLLPALQGRNTRNITTRMLLNWMG